MWRGVGVIEAAAGGWGLGGGPGSQRGPKILGKPETKKRSASARAPFCLTFPMCFNPSPKLKAPLNAGSKPKAEHKPSTLTNLHPKPSQSSCRLQALYSHHPTRGRVYRHIWGTRPTLNPEKVGLRARVLSRAHTFRKQASKQDLFYTHTHIYIYINANMSLYIYIL